MSSAAFERIQGILDGKVQLKGNKTRDIKGLRNRASRVAGRAPEVMVKITGFGKGVKHVKAHLDYVGRNAKLDLENERGDIIQGKEGIKELHEEWMSDRGKCGKNTRDTTNIVLSMPPSTDEKKMKKAVRGFAREQFGDNHQYVWVMHADEKHPHAHLTVKNYGYDGSRLHVAKGDPQKWRELFAKKLRENGINAEATARVVRGKVKKGENQAVRHIRGRGITPKVDKAKVGEVAAEMKTGKRTPKPWEARIKERQTNVRREWLASAKELSLSTDPQDNELSRNIVAYVKAMPSLNTERHDLKEFMATKAADKQADKGR